MFLKIIPDEDNDEIYKRAKSQCEILCIVDYTKMIKSDKFRSTYFSFFSLNTKNFTLRFCMFVDFHH
jgi:hypothetical protein